MAEYTCVKTGLTEGNTKLIRVKSLDPKWKDSPGFMMPESFVEKFEKSKKFEVHSDDIWFTCFPKTGSTWAQEMVWLLNNDMDFEAAKTLLQVNRYLYYE
jgi:hypothetical protein